MLLEAGLLARSRFSGVLLSTCFVVALGDVSCRVVVWCGVVWCALQLLFYFEILLVMLPVYRETNDTEVTYNVSVCPQFWCIA